MPVQFDQTHVVPMSSADCVEAATIDQAANRHPWSLRHFQDSLHQQHPAFCLWRDATLLGFWVAMPVVDELHLLALTVNVQHQQQGLGRRLLQHFMDCAQQHSIPQQPVQSLWLEVSAQNQAAIALYQAMNWQVMGRRKQYYPAVAGVRDDALLMSYVIHAELDR